MADTPTQVFLIVLVKRLRTLFVTVTELPVVQRPRRAPVLVR